MVKKFTKKILTRILRRGDDSSEEPKTPKERIAQMSEKALRKECLELQGSVVVLNEALSDIKEKDEYLTAQITELAAAAETARGTAWNSFERVFGEDAKETKLLQGFIAALEKQINDGKLSQEIGSKMLAVAKHGISAAEQWPKFKIDAKAWNRDSARLRIDIASTKQDMVDIRNELRLLKQIEELNEIKNWTIGLIRNSPNLPLSKRINEYLRVASGDASQSGVRRLEEATLFAIISDLLATEKQYFIDSAKEQRKAEDFEAKYSRLLEQLRIINSDAVGEIEERIGKADRLKDEEEKGGPRGVSEPFVDIFKDIVPKAVTKRAILHDIYSVLLSHFPEEKDTIAKLVEGVKHLVDADVRVAEYIQTKLVQQRSALIHLKDTSSKLYAAVQALFPEPNTDKVSETYAANRKKLVEILASKDIPAKKNEQLAAFIGEKLATRDALEEAVEKIAEHKEVFYDLIVLATNDAVDEDRFNQNPGVYVVEAVNQLKNRLSAIADYSTLKVDPLTLVKKAGVHQMLGNIYAANGDEVNAAVQYRQAGELCETAREITPEDGRDSVEAEIAKLEKPDKGAEK